MSKICVLCSAKGSKLQCPRCLDVYCSAECQKADWSSHRPICFRMPALIAIENVDQSSSSELQTVKNNAVDLTTPPKIPSRRNSEANSPKTNNEIVKPVEVTPAKNNLTKPVELSAPRKSSEEVRNIQATPKVPAVTEKPLKFVPKQVALKKPELEKSKISEETKANIEGNKFEEVIEKIQEVKISGDSVEKPEKKVEETKAAAADGKIKESEGGKQAVDKKSFNGNVKPSQAAQDSKKTLEDKITADSSRETKSSTKEVEKAAQEEKKFSRQEKNKKPHEIVTEAEKIPLKVDDSSKVSKHSCEEPKESVRMMKENLSFQKWSDGKNIKVKIVTFLDGNVFTFSELSEAVDAYYQYIDKTISDYCRDKPEENYLPVQGEVVLAVFEGDWYRAHVLDPHPNGTIVQFIDYGNMSTVKLHQMKKIPLDMKFDICARDFIVDNFPEKLSDKQMKILSSGVVTITNIHQDGSQLYHCKIFGF